MKLMDEEIRVPVELPLDDDGFLRRECPSCENEFKWFSHNESDPDLEHVNQYFCPLCGAPADPDSWWTPDQIEYGLGSAGGEIDRAVGDAVADMFKGMKGFTFKPNADFSLDIGTPDPLVEPNDMVIVQPPCHPHEPIKVPQTSISKVHCLICGSPFAA